MIRILFVCMGNICRSPTAHGVFRQLLEKENLARHIEIDSAGTGGWHVGRPPDSRAQAAALQRGIRIDDLRGRQVDARDFEEFDYILAMDRGNLRDLLAQAEARHHHKVRLFLDFVDDPAMEEVPDPYYGGESGFDRVLDMIEMASQGLLEQIRERIEPPR
jgi:protein-tyrosine phosphatase